MRKPLIGITSSYEHNPESENAYKTSVSIDYSRAVMNAGGIPVVLPVHDNIEVIREQISHLDGLLLSGGVDSDPALYGEDSLQEIGVISPERDKFEIMLLEEYLKTDKPILAICRGLQLVNIYFGGTLYQDIKYLDTQIQHKQKWHLYLPTHNIDILGKDNILYEIFGEKTRVNSFHHQMIKDLAEGLTPIAKSSDGVIEALQKKDHPFFYATQWHPEMMAVRGNDEMKKILDKTHQKARVGLIATGDSFVAGQDKIDRIKEHFPDVLAVEMEGAAIAQATHSIGLPFMVIRAMSDTASHDANVTFDEFILEAGKRSAETLIQFLKELV